MCYTGVCKYEDYMGNCQLPKEKFPEDCFCVFVAKRDVMDSTSPYETIIKNYKTYCKKQRSIS